jgi:hypothetical protein
MTSSATFDLADAARWIDVVLVVAAAPFVVLMGAPVLGYAAGATGWVVTRVAGHLIERRAQRSDNPRTVVGLTLFSGLGRAWAMGLIIVVVGVAGEREDGLTAAVLAFVAFSVYLAARITLGPQRRKPVSS